MDTPAETIDRSTCTKCQHCGQWTNYADDPVHKQRMRELADARGGILYQIHIDGELEEQRRFRSDQREALANWAADVRKRTNSSDVFVVTEESPEFIGLARS